jgi:hypothetical protein
MSSPEQMLLAGQSEWQMNWPTILGDPNAAGNVQSFGYQLILPGQLSRNAILAVRMGAELALAQASDRETKVTIHHNDQLNRDEIRLPGFIPAVKVSGDPFGRQEPFILRAIPRVLLYETLADLPDQRLDLIATIKDLYQAYELDPASALAQIRADNERARQKVMATAQGSQKEWVRQGIQTLIRTDVVHEGTTAGLNILLKNEKLFSPTGSMKSPADARRSLEIILETRFIGGENHGNLYDLRQRALQVLNGPEGA